MFTASVLYAHVDIADILGILVLFFNLLCFMVLHSLTKSTTDSLMLEAILKLPIFFQYFTLATTKLLDFIC